jgi:hypothetical protein
MDKVYGLKIEISKRALITGLIVFVSGIVTGALLTAIF